MESITKVKRYNQGTGGVHLISSFNKDEAMQKAQEVKSSIDTYRSPMIYGPHKNSQGEWVVEVRYYGLD